MKPVLAILITVLAGLLMQVNAGQNATGWVSLAWSNSPTPTVIAHRIYYGVASGTYTNFLSVSVPSSTCTISNLQCGATYYFTAVATDGVDEAPPSNEVYTKIKPGKANGLTIINQGSQ